MRNQNKKPEIQQMYENGLIISYHFNNFDDETPLKQLTSTELISLTIKPYLKEILNNNLNPELEEEVNNRIKKLLKSTINKIIKREVNQLLQPAITIRQKNPYPDEIDNFQEDLEFYDILEKIEDLEKEVEKDKKELEKAIKRKNEKMIEKLKDKIQRKEQKIKYLQKKAGIEKIDPKQLKKEAEKNRQKMKEIEEKVIPFLTENVTKDIFNIVNSNTLYECLEKIYESPFLSENEKQIINMSLREIPYFLSDQISIYKVEKSLEETTERESSNILERRTKVHTYDVQKYLYVKANEMIENLKIILDTNTNDEEEKKARRKTEKIQNIINKLSYQYPDIFYAKINEERIPIPTKLYIQKIVLTEIIKFISEKINFEMPYVSIENVEKLGVELLKIAIDDSIETPIYLTEALELTKKYLNLRKKEKLIIAKYFYEKENQAV